MSSVLSTGKVERIELGTHLQAAELFARAHPTWHTDTQADTSTAISGSGRVSSAAAAVMDVAQRLTAHAVWQATQASSSAPDAVSATSDASTPAGRYSVSVDAIAMAQATTSATFSSLSTVIGLGTLNIELGSWNSTQTAFVTNPNWPKASVSIGVHDNPMERIRDKINAAGIGVIATVVTDATGARLVLRSTHSGEAQGFKVSVDSPDDSKDLSPLGFDPSTQPDGTGMAMTRPAQDARLRIDDQSVTGAVNLVDSGVPGLTLQLKSPAAEVQIDVTRDPLVAVQAMSQFVDRFNFMHDAVAELPDSATTSPSSTRLASRLMQSVQQSLQGDDAAALRTSGLALDGQGKLSLDRAAALRQLDTPDSTTPDAWMRMAMRLDQADAQQAPGATAQPASPVTVPATQTVAPSDAGPLQRLKLLTHYLDTQRDADESAAAGPWGVNRENMA